MLPLSVLAEARRDVLKIAKDHSPTAMLKICEMGGLIEGVPSATSEAVRFAACMAVLDRAHGRAHLSLGEANTQPLLVDFQWRTDEPPRRLIEATAIEHDDGETT